jgi:hypothetical protein
MKSDNPQVQRWLDNENFQNFLRQVHMDIHVGLKNGASVGEVKGALGLLAHAIVTSVNFDSIKK